MSFLLGSGSKAKQIPDITGLQIQTAVNVLPIPIIYGSPRVTMNIIYANGFLATHTNSGGGKGLLTGGKGGASKTTYSATFIGAIGEGPMGNIIAVFDNQTVYTPSTAPPGRGGFAIFPGTHGQPAWSGVSSRWPSDAFGYTNTYYLGFPDYPLDSSATIPLLNFILPGHFAATSPLYLFTAPDAETFFFDADPALCIYDFLTNETYGAGFPYTFIDTATLNTSAKGFDAVIGDAAVSTYCQAVGLAWSVVLNNNEPAASILDRWCKNLTIAPVWTGAVLKFIPYWEMFSGENPGWGAGAGIAKKYYRPNIAPLFDFTDSDFQQSAQGEDPVVVTRIDIADAKNVIRLDYKDRNNQFNSNVAEAKDETAVELFGPRVDRAGSADEFTHGGYANVSVGIRLQRSLAVRSSYMFKLPWQWCVLDPMDIVTITDEILGLYRFPVRIISLEEDDKGILTVVAEEFSINSAASTVYPHQENIPPIIDTGKPAPAVNTPFIFEPTMQMLTAQSRSVMPTLSVGISGGPGGVFDPNWGGCNVFVSNDGVTYVDQGTFIGPSRMGVTTATLAAWSSITVDNTNTLSVDLTESKGTLDTVTTAQAIGGLSLCGIIDSFGDIEFLTYTTATLTAANKYDLTGLYRGLYGTVACSHTSPSKFLRIDSNVFSEALPANFIDKMLWLKLQSFNIFGQGIEDISTCAVYTFTQTGAGTNLPINPIWSALLAGVAVDLENSSSDVLDLNIGGSGACGPILSVVDLESV